MVHSPLADCIACMPAALARALDADAQLRAHWQALPQRQLRAGTHLLRLGDTPQHVWWIRSGLVRFYFATPEGVERNKSFHAEGAWIGSGMPPRPTASPYGIEALEDTQLLELPYADLAEGLRHVPALAALHEEAMDWTFQRQARREAELLSQDAAARYLRFLQERPAVAARVPLHHVASHLGITNVALSRIRKRLGLGRGAAAPAR